MLCMCTTSLADCCYVIDELPIAMARPRFGFGKVFYPQKKEKLAYSLLIKKQHNGTPFECPIALSIIFHMPIPKSYSKKKRSLILDNELLFVKKPDIDNLIAFVLNCMTGIVYKDDAQVYSIAAIKKFSDNPKIEIFVQCKE